LTDLPNRALFLDRLTRGMASAHRDGRQVAVLFLDLDRFKVINDSLGHHRGDAMLVCVAGRLRQCVRAEDTVARLGGDEFTVLLENVDDDSEAKEIADRIAHALRSPIVLGGHEVFVSASVGIALSRPRADDPDSLLRRADLALYRAKSQGKARYAVFDPVLETSAFDRLELETDLQYALDRGQFQLDYQPIVDLASGRIVGVEALVRWDRPGRGRVLPAEFIPVAEEMGLVIPLGHWVLSEACRQVAEWQRQLGAWERLMLNVNLSGRQFQDPDLHTDIMRNLETSGLDPQCLIMEITESVIMQDAQSAVGKLEALKALGVQLAIDDFGTGYSSLSYLRRFPVDTLKIDRSFISGIGNGSQDAAIVDSVVALAKSLGLTVTGEGIETSAQAAYLRMLGCDHGQGEWYSGPLPAAALLRLLQRGYTLGNTAAA
jgi:diguanylate cyclase (GGDEF)-like protein